VRFVFRLPSPKDFQMSALKEFLSSFGSKIKFLELSNQPLRRNDPQNNYGPALSIILRNVVILESLDVSRWFSGFSETTRGVSLPRLQCLHINSWFNSDDVICGLLDGAPGLKECKSNSCGFKIQDLGILVRQGKLRTVHEVNLKLKCKGGRLNAAAALARTGACQFRFMRITLGKYELDERSLAQAGAILNSIWDLSKDVLEDMTADFSLGLKSLRLKYLKSPTMSVLRHICFTRVDWNSFLFPAEDFPRISKLYPKLASLSIEFRRDAKRPTEGRGWNSIFPPETRVDSLRTLSLWNSSGLKDWIPQMSRTFWNLRELQLWAVSGHLTTFAHELWTHLTGLEVMKLEISGELWFDSAFTGIPPKTCEEVAKNVKKVQEFPVADLAKLLRVKSSIANLKSKEKNSSFSFISWFLSQLEKAG
jgi:hypothetical protein